MVSWAKTAQGSRYIALMTEIIMAELVADCPRCRAKSMTFDVAAELFLYQEYSWKNWYETFCVCRQCKRSTIFVLSQSLDTDFEVVHRNGLLKLSGAVNRYMDIEGFINLKDIASAQPPEHLPTDIQAAFTEGAKCLAIGCPNAAGTMFRLCVDIATRDKLPKEEVEGLNSKTRRDLGLRLPWLFKNGLLPNDLEDLSSCIKEDGNDGAHAGSLKKEDSEDLLDFTIALLERIYTEPQRLKLAKERRSDRRDKKK